MNITNDIVYVGVNDYQIDLFEGQYEVPNGMAYNSYLILDSQIAVLNSVDANFSEQWLENIENCVGDKKIDYLIIQHMEPDHSGSIIDFLNKYEDVTLVASSKAFLMLQNFFNQDFGEHKIIINEGDTLSLGKHTLSFINAPMVHWPEVIFVYDILDKVLFSADAFGKFGALDIEEDWACEARRYYFGIVGKYGVQVQNVLKKLESIEVVKICPLHGPILDKNLPYYLNLYKVWSSYQVEEEGIVINYVSIYGNTKKAVYKLKELLELKGIKKIVINDLARCDMFEAVEDSFRYSKMVLACPTYNNDLFPFMKTFIHALIERNYKNRTIGFIENGSWAPTANKIMKQMLEKSQDIVFIDSNVTIKSALNNESLKELENLSNKLI